ncbi:MAG: FGGY family carbohydrate kinase, partial [Candidatus Humimicrobiaceae bacterium]
MSQKNYLVFDYGASNGRAAVASFDGSRFDMEVTHRFENRPVFAGGTLYWDMLRLFSELKIGIQSSVKKYKDIISMGIDTWGADFGLLDSQGKLISNPINYRDEQSGKDSASLFEVISQKELWDLTGAWCIPLFDVFQLYSQKINGSTAIKNAKTYQSIADIFNYFLTGKTVNEFTRFTTSVLYNQKEGKIEDSIFKRLDLPREIFPRMVFP